MEHERTLNGRVALWRPRSPETNLVASGRADIPADLIDWLAAQPLNDHGCVTLDIVLFPNTRRESDRAPTTTGYIKRPRAAVDDASEVAF